ncbi:rhodanese-like domain-containing protein [Chloroflexota bacterium]
MKVIIGILSVCLVTVILTGAVFVAGCTPEQVTTTVNLTTTATETLPPETIVTTATKTVTLSPEPSMPNQITEGITAAEAFNMIQANINNPDFVIIDVRTPEERSVSYIEGSILLDWNDGVFAAEVESLDRCTTYLLY